MSTANGLSDNELYTSFISTGDEKALRILFERYRIPLTLFIREIVHNSDDAEELMMDCFAVVISLRSKYSGRHGASFKTWLYAMAGNKARGFIRKHRRTILLTQDESIEDIVCSEGPENDILKA